MDNIKKSCEVGDKFINKLGYEYEVIENLGNRKYKIRFINTGFEIISRKNAVLNGHIKDYLAPSVYSVGIIGTEIKNTSKHYLYDRWTHMLGRCYDENNDNYYLYGKKGVRVDTRWHYFPNFVKDIESKENSDKLKDKKNKWVLDKDILGKELKIYSNETTIIISNSANTKEKNTRCGNPSQLRKIKVMRFNLKGDYINTFNSITEANIFCNKKNDDASIRQCCNLKRKTAYGYTWMYEKDFVDFESAKTRILERMNKKSNKNKSENKLLI